NHGIPCYTIENTLKSRDWAWLTNWIESWMSADLWHTCTSATTAMAYRLVLQDYADRTSDQAEWFVDFQGHDFSFRGQTCLEAAEKSGAAHLTSFKGTDTCPSIAWIKSYYPGGDRSELLGTSVPATEHSVMCAGGKDDERETFIRLLTKVYPSGILSVVS